MPADHRPMRIIPLEIIFLTTQSWSPLTDFHVQDSGYCGRTALARTLGLLAGVSVPDQPNLLACHILMGRQRRLARKYCRRSSPPRKGSWTPLTLHCVLPLHFSNYRLCFDIGVTDGAHEAWAKLCYSNLYSNLGLEAILHRHIAPC